MNRRGRNWADFDNDRPTWFPTGPGPSSMRNDHYRNAYPNYESGYGRGGWEDFGPPNPPPEFFTRRGFVPQGAPFIRREKINQHVVKFLIRCGIPQNTVKTLPAAFLVLIEHNYCGLCAMSLENENIASLHYTSKNHKKKQQKWLAEFHDPERFNNNLGQAPMRARELYCELCDVQITSKTHADSHYSGKPHRAIVEGRTAPKNPFLNQIGMENRLRQLIRREKRKLTEEAAAEGPAVQAKKVHKHVSDELYCQICKVTVTCVDQMTNHMNGKKHLTKEKQHILNTMKGVRKDMEQPENKAVGEDSTQEGNDVDLDGAECRNGEQGDHGEDNIEKESDEKNPDTGDIEDTKANKAGNSEDSEALDYWKDGGDW